MGKVLGNGMRVEVIPTINDSAKRVEVRVQPGQVYRFETDVHTRSGLVHRVGDLLIVQDSTLLTPHGESSESGVNWVCETQHSTSCWATL